LPLMNSGTSCGGGPCIFSSRKSVVTLSRAGDRVVVVKRLRVPSPELVLRLRNEHRTLLRLPPRLGPFRIPRAVSCAAKDGRLVTEYLPGCAAATTKFPAGVSDPLVLSLFCLPAALRPGHVCALRWPFEELAGPASASDSDLVAYRLARSVLAAEAPLVPGHGDLLPRNVLLDAIAADPALLDWEWAGLYPAMYDEATLWVSLLLAADQQLLLAPALRSLPAPRQRLFCAAVWARARRERSGVFSDRTAAETLALDQVRAAAGRALATADIAALIDWRAALR
jgi:hypothetical protein